MLGSRSSGPWRMRSSRCSHSLIPMASATNTTGDTGRNVPVPRSMIGKGRSCAATARRCRSISSSAAAATRSGGTSVMCVGIERASGSPNDARDCCSSSPYGSGIGIATPLVRSAGSGTAQEPAPIADRLHGVTGDLARAGGAAGQHAGELLFVGEELLGALADGGEGVQDSLGEVLLQRAVALTGIAGLQLRNGRVTQRGVDTQKIGAARLVLLVGDDLGARVGHRAHDLLAQRARLVEKVGDGVR